MDVAACLAIVFALEAESLIETNRPARAIGFALTGFATSAIAGGGIACAIEPCATNATIANVSRDLLSVADLSLAPIG